MFRFVLRHHELGHLLSNIEQLPSSLPSPPHLGLARSTRAAAAQEFESADRVLVFRVHPIWAWPGPLGPQRPRSSRVPTVYSSAPRTHRHPPLHSRRSRTHHNHADAVTLTIPILRPAQSPPLLGCPVSGTHQWILTGFSCVKGTVKHVFRTLWK
jgi:hypothetical protein